MPRQTSIQLTEATERQIDALKAQGYGSLTDIIRIAIDRMWMSEFFAAGPTPATAIQLWQHRTAGEQYIVCIENGHVTGAVGPIYQPEREAQILAAHTADWEWDAELADDIAEHDGEYRCMWPYVSG